MAEAIAGKGVLALANFAASPARNAAAKFLDGKGANLNKLKNLIKTDTSRLKEGQKLEKLAPLNTAVTTIEEAFIYLSKKNYEEARKNFEKATILAKTYFEGLDKTKYKLQASWVTIVGSFFVQVIDTAQGLKSSSDIHTEGQLTFKKVTSLRDLQSEYQYFLSQKLGSDQIAKEKLIHICMSYAWALQYCVDTILQSDMYVNFTCNDINVDGRQITIHPMAMYPTITDTKPSPANNDSLLKELTDDSFLSLRKYNCICTLWNEKEDEIHTSIHAQPSADSHYYGEVRLKCTLNSDADVLCISGQIVQLPEEEDKQERELSHFNIDLSEMPNDKLPFTDFSNPKISCSFRAGLLCCGIGFEVLLIDTQPTKGKLLWRVTPQKGEFVVKTGWKYDNHIQVDLESTTKYLKLFPKDDFNNEFAKLKL